jgi:hypothetical protein
VPVWHAFCATIPEWGQASQWTEVYEVHTALDHGKEVCVDSRRGEAILGVGGPGPPKGDDEHQLSPDRGGEKT